MIFLLWQVTDSKGHTLVNNEDKNKGKFAFTTDDYEVFEIWFISKVAPSNNPFMGKKSINELGSSY